MKPAVSCVIRINQSKRIKSEMIRAVQGRRGLQLTHVKRAKRTSDRALLGLFVGGLLGREDGEIVGLFVGGFDGDCGIQCINNKYYQKHRNEKCVVALHSKRGLSSLLLMEPCSGSLMEKRLDVRMVRYSDFSSAESMETAVSSVVTKNISERIKIKKCFVVLHDKS